MLGLTACGLYSGGKAMITSHSSGKRTQELDNGDVVESTARPARPALPPADPGADPPQLSDGHST